MRFPTKHSCGYAICQALYEFGPLTAAGVHAALPPRFNNERTIAAVLVSLQDQGCIVTHEPDGLYLLTLAATRHMDQCAETGAAPPIDQSRIATPRTPPPFRPLTYKPSSYGKREGSNDHKAYKSRHF